MGKSYKPATKRKWKVSCKIPGCKKTRPVGRNPANYSGMKRLCSKHYEIEQERTKIETAIQYRQRHRERERIRSRIRNRKIRIATGFKCVSATPGYRGRTLSISHIRGTLEDGWWPEDIIWEELKTGNHYGAELIDDKGGKYSPQQLMKVDFHLEE